MPAVIEWRPVTLVKNFAGSAETLTAIQLTSRRDDGRCCAPRSSHPVTSWQRRTNTPYEIRAASDEECMAGRVLKRIAKENVNVSLSLPFNREFAPRSAAQSVEKSDSVTKPLHFLWEFFDFRFIFRDNYDYSFHIYIYINNTIGGSPIVMKFAQHM